MDDKTFRRHKKISKNHTQHCSECGDPKREGCRSSSCDVKHCACAMTDPTINH